MAAPILQDYQFWFGSHDGEGLVIGEGTLYDIVRVQGLHSYTVRSGNRLLPRNHGAVPGLHLLDMKIVTMDIETPDRESYLDFLRVYKVLRDAEGELHFKLPGIRQSFHRARVATRNEEQTGLNVGLIPITLGFECADPRIYSRDSESIVVGVYNPAGGGVDWENDWELDFSGSGSGQDVIAHNDGDDFAYPIVKFFGPTLGDCTAVNLQNLTTGVDMEITTSLLTGQILTADMDARIRGTGTRVIDLSGSSRYGDWELPRETFVLAPGDNIIRLEITGTSTDVLATLNWRHTST